MASFTTAFSPDARPAHTCSANSAVLLAAVDALSAAQLAVENRNQKLVNRSRSLYGDRVESDAALDSGPAGGSER